MQRDFITFPHKYFGDVKIYTANTGVDQQGYQIWQKPRGASMVSMVVLAGGGGGGGGFTRPSNSAGGGGAGGACSGIVRFKCLAMLLPDILYIQVGAGGIGGAASTAGTAGINSYVLTSKTNVLPNIICYSGVNAPGGGSPGAGSGSAAVGGTVPSIAVTQPPNAYGHWFANVGLVGGAGGVRTGGVAADITAWATIPLSPGAGGGGSSSSAANFSGGGVLPTALLDIGNAGYFPAATYIANPGTSAPSINGDSGLYRITPFFNCGGAGGASNDTGQAGHGGYGGYGCGGGGGGGGTTGGMGGNGGSGLVIIVTA